MIIQKLYITISSHLAREILFLDILWDSNLWIHIYFARFILMTMKCFSKAMTKMLFDSLIDNSMKIIAFSYNTYKQRRQVMNILHLNNWKTKKDIRTWHQNSWMKIQVDNNTSSNTTTFKSHQSKIAKQMLGLFEFGFRLSKL